MRGVLAFSVLSVGLGFAAYSYMPDAFDAADPRLAFAATPALAATRDATPAVGRLTDFSPGAGLRRSLMIDQAAVPPLTGFDGEAARLATYVGRFADAQAEAQALPSLQTPPVELSPWRSAVLVEASGLGPNGTQVAAAFLSPSTRLQLVTALQHELKRVGCYAGAASGSWDRETRAAVATFMDRVNAVLPVDQPDVTLLELVKAHPRTTCEASCPDGQSFDNHGHCVPTAILASAARPRLKSKPQLAERPAQMPTTLAKLESVPAPKPAAFPAPMALGAGSLADRTGARPSAALIAATTTAQGEMAAAAPVTAQTAAQSAPSKRKPQKVAQQARRSTTYRTVQHLFEHPLGRL